VAKRTWPSRRRRIFVGLFGGAICGLLVAAVQSAIVTVVLVSLVGAAVSVLEGPKAP
jgi:hypothetical protein